MAKQMFYTLQEAAQHLGVDEQAIKDMAGEGRLQQFRDRDQLMFKCDEIEAMAASAGNDAPPSEAAATEEAEQIDLSDSGVIPLADDSAAGEEVSLSPDDTSLTGQGEEPSTGSGTGMDAISLADEPDAPATDSAAEDSSHGTGVSVFDADEIEPADPTAQTQMNRPAIGEEEALENVGSGSGLLDLTRESDDTSLGAAELLDEIGDTNQSVAGASAADALESAVGSSGMLEATQAGPDSGPELEAMQSGTRMGMEQPGDALGNAPLGAYSYAEPYDPAGSGLAAGMLMGVIVTLAIGLLLAVGAMLGVRTPVHEQMLASQNSLLLWCGGLLVMSFVLGIIGMLVGKAGAARSDAGSGA